MRRKNTDIERLVEEQRRSGETVREFCAVRGLDRKTFYVWRQRARGSVDRFARVATDDRVELELSGGARVRVAREDLKAVLEALR
jgi:hypothetical protein